MKRPKHILVIRLSALGDVAMVVPVVRAFCSAYPEIKITMLSRKQYQPLFAEFEQVHFFEAQIKAKHKGFFGVLKLANEVKELGIDAIADLHNVIRSKVITKRLRLAGISAVTMNKGRAEKKKLTQAQGLGLVQLKSTHQRYADVFRQLGFPITLDAPSFPKRGPLSPRLQNLIGSEPKKMIGIAPFAAYDSKMYPLSLMEEVVASLDASRQFYIVLFGGGKKEIDSLQSMAKPYTSVTNVAGKLPFEEELQLISNLDVMVAMDSANGHLAANYGIPVVTLWGVTHPYVGFVPFNQPMENQLMANRNDYPLIPTSVYGNKFPKGYENSMETISPKTVIKKIVELI